MARKASSKPGSPSSQSSATIGFEAKLWLAADKLRNNMDAAEYKHVVLGLVFLKYVSDAFAEVMARRTAAGLDPEDRAAYQAEGVFWVPKAARWAGLLAHADAPDLGRRIDAAMAAVPFLNLLVPVLGSQEWTAVAFLSRIPAEASEITLSLGLRGPVSAEEVAALLKLLWRHRAEVRCAARHQLVRDLSVPPGTARLQHRLVISAKPKPVQTVEDRIHGFLGGSLPIRVLDPQQELAPLRAGV